MDTIIMDTIMDTTVVIPVGTLIRKTITATRIMATLDTHAHTSMQTEPLAINKLLLYQCLI